jgi:hypothetical protein
VKAQKDIKYERKVKRHGKTTNPLRQHISQKTKPRIE